MDVFWVGVADRAAKSHAAGVIQLVVFSQKKKPELTDSHIPPPP